MHPSCEEDARRLCPPGMSGMPYRGGRGDVRRWCTLPRLLLHLETAFDASNISFNTEIMEVVSAVYYSRSVIVKVILGVRVDAVRRTLWVSPATASACPMRQPHMIGTASFLHITENKRLPSMLLARFPRLMIWLGWVPCCSRSRARDVSEIQISKIRSSSTCRHQISCSHSLSHRLPFFPASPSPPHLAFSPLASGITSFHCPLVGSRMQARVKGGRG